MRFSGVFEINIIGTAHIYIFTSFRYISFYFILNINLNKLLNFDHRKKMSSTKLDINQLLASLLSDASRASSVAGVIKCRKL